VPFGILLAALVAAPLHVCLGCNFAGARLADTDFGGTVYIGTNFAGAVLARSSFRNATLVAANFQGSDLRGAAFDEAQCTACNFLEAKLDGATFIGVRMTATNLAGFASDVADAQLRELLARCYACNFRGAVLTGRDLSGASLAGVDLSNADLRRTNFDGAALCAYVFDGARFNAKCPAMQGARVEGASFRGVRLCADASDPRTCNAVTAEELRSWSGSSLAGAALP
jgi:uncharacterized protein YjbI with pentapeptide repeats